MIDEIVAYSFAVGIVVLLNLVLSMLILGFVLSARLGKKEEEDCDEC